MARTPETAALAAWLDEQIELCRQFAGRDWRWHALGNELDADAAFGMLCEFRERVRAVAEGESIEEDLSWMHAMLADDA